MNYKCTEQRFLNDVAEHQMIVLRDDGLHRHIRFKRPNSTSYYFDLITWPGYLCYCGDMGTYVFQRIDDMFAFFRTDRRDFNFNKNGLSINPGYWGEKLQAVSLFGEGYRKFNEERFNRIVIEYLVGWIRENRDRTAKHERRELWDEVVFRVINADGDSGGFRKQTAAHDFWHQVNPNVGEFTFQDFWEYDCTEFTFHFIWCCYALAWGVEQYDALAAQVASLERENKELREIAAGDPHH